MVAVGGNEGFVGGFSLGVGCFGDEAGGLGVLCEVFDSLRADLLNEVYAMSTGSILIHNEDHVRLRQINSIANCNSSIILIDFDNALAWVSVQHTAVILAQLRC